MLLIDEEDKLAAFLKNINEEMESVSCDERFVAVDTEFIREHSKDPLLCLIQIATSSDVFIIDPMAVDVFPLRKLFENPNFRKVFHSAAQDLELLELAGINTINNMYDTQLYESILSTDYCIGYQAIVFRYLNEKIEKDHRRSNWQKRPLDKNQLKYSTDDVFYLRKVYKSQLQKLQLLHRENWLDEEELYLESNDVVPKKHDNQSDSIILLKTLLEKCSQSHQIARATIATSRDLEKL
ncbi:MAG: ribonuclease D, partial [Holosporaceae bacterium]|nr:ribonuclease D [Holosporaceae bacterium]